VGHPKELLQAIMETIKRSYPATEGYRYLLEQRLCGFAKNIQPDIQVLKRNGKVVCVVEIGYTRPEKIRWYRKLEIPDIRWLDMFGNAVDPFASTTKVVKEVAWRPAQEERWRYVIIRQGIRCEGCFNELLEEVEEQYGKDSSDALSQADNQYWDEADVLAEFWSNGSRGFVLAYCDVCGDNFLINNTCYEDEILNFTNERGYYDHDAFIAEHYHQSAESHIERALWSKWLDRMDPLEKKIFLFEALDFAELREWTSRALGGVELDYGQIKSFRSFHRGI
jgi:hypothetical protein